MSFRKLSDRHLATLSLLLTAVLAIIIYWATLDLPLIYDDLLHIRIADDLDFLSVWLPTEAFGFYRPLTFVPLLIIQKLFSGYPATLLHGLNVFQHALNGVLLGWLSWRLWQRWHWTLATGLIFVFFPFSYQAVAVYGHNVHPTITGLILLGLHTYLSAIKVNGRSRVIWWTLTGALFLLGLLAHESAVIFGFLAATVHFNAKGAARIGFRGKESFAVQPWFYFIIIGGLYAVAYQFLPLSRAPQASFGTVQLQQKAYYLLQAAAYPLAWFGRWLPENRGSLAVILGVVAMAALTLWAAQEKSTRLPLLMGWTWWLLGSLLLAISLSASYLLHGPRLLYLSAAGVALLWPVLLEPLWQRASFGRTVWVLSLIFILSLGGFFIGGRLQAYEQLVKPIETAADVLEDRSAEEGLLFINLPQWLTPAENTFPIGVEIASILGDYLFVEELIQVNTSVDHPVQTWKVADLLASTPYHYAIHTQNVSDAIKVDWNMQGSHIVATYFGDDGLSAVYTGSLRPDSSQETLLADFGPYQVTASEAYSCNGEVVLDSIWRIVGSGKSDLPVQATTSLFVQELDDAGQIISQADGPLLNLRPDLINLPSGWIIADQRILDNPDRQGSRVMLGVYDYLSGVRFAAFDKDGNALESDALEVVITECE